MAEIHYVGGVINESQFVRFVKRSTSGDRITVDHPDMIEAVRKFIKRIDPSKEISIVYTKGIQEGMLVKHPEFPGLWEVVRDEGDFVQMQPAYNGVPVSVVVRRVQKSELTLWRR